MKDLRCGIGDGLWINLPRKLRDKVRKSDGDAVAPCGIVGFKKDIRLCKDNIYAPLCKMCKGNV